MPQLGSFQSTVPACLVQARGAEGKAGRGAATDASSRSRAKVRAWFRKLEPAAAQARAALLAAPVPARAAPALAARLPSRARASIEVEGVGDLPMTLARCCGPTRPQAIMGYVTLLRGLTIHRGDCASLARMRALKPERVLRVEWTGDATGAASGRLRAPR